MSVECKHYRKHAAGGGLCRHPEINGPISPGRCSSCPLRVALTIGSTSARAPANPVADRPRVVRWIQARRRDGEQGVGDTLARLIDGVGGRIYKRLMDRLGLPCGCTDRQKWLNERFPYVD